MPSCTTSRAEPGLCAVVLNWRNWEDTRACLESLLAARPRPGTVVLVDNGSGDGSVQRARAWAGERFRAGEVHEAAGPHPEPPAGPAPAFCLVANPENLGFGAGNNAGVRLALALGADYLWLLNNDTEVRPDAPAKLLECAAARPQAGLLGCTVALHHAPEVAQCAGGFRYAPWLTRIRPALGGRPLAELLAAPEPRLDYVYGAALFARAEVFRRVGMLSEANFLFYEELDLCLRARAAGFGLGWCREAVVLHKVSRSVGRPGQDRDRERLAAYHENLSTLRFTARHYPRRLPVAAGVRLAAKLASAVLKGRPWLAGPLVRAYADFLRGRYS